MIHHEIKIQKEFAEAVFLGEKTFEVRNNDRGYQKGDLIKFKVTDGSDKAGGSVSQQFITR